ncbi:MAG: hypothetical protein JWR67_2610 [Mucilaginibacter sp.]|nr:hypothetical protein [Mucilaginibacter sp.]
MLKKLLVILFFYSSYVHAETIKTDVLIIGGSPSGIAAAIQCARSKVKTLLIAQNAWLEPLQANNMVTITHNRNLPSGLWGEFSGKIKDFYKSTPGYDTTYNAALQFEPFTGAAILKKMADTVKNLTIKLNTPFKTIKKDGTGWEVSIIVNGKTDIVKTKVLIDATEKGEVVTKAGATFPAVFDSRRDNSGETYRTSIAAGGELPGATNNVQPSVNYPPFPAYCIPMRNVVVRDADNLLVTEKVLPVNGNVQFLPVEMALGQGVGTVAAYCAFFKTTTKNLKVRIIQNELLDFKGYLLPFADIKPGYRYIRAVQQIGATGLLKGVQSNEGLLFKPDAVVTTAEVKPVLTEVYSRAFLWFNRVKPGEKFTIGNLLSFISEITLSEPQTLQLTMERDWQTKYQFNTAFDMNSPVTRMEFAVLINQLLNPFARTVDLAGNLVY